MSAKRFDVLLQQGEMAAIQAHSGRHLATASSTLSDTAAEAAAASTPLTLHVADHVPLLPHDRGSVEAQQSVTPAWHKARDTARDTLHGAQLATHLQHQTAPGTTVAALQQQHPSQPLDDESRAALRTWIAERRHFAPQYLNRATQELVLL